MKLCLHLAIECLSKHMDLEASRTIRNAILKIMSGMRNKELTPREKAEVTACYRMERNKGRERTKFEGR